MVGIYERGIFQADHDFKEREYYVQSREGLANCRGGQLRQPIMEETEGVHFKVGRRGDPVSARQRNSLLRGR